eukprot:TRINITY_DN8707_c0_g1_i1.p2 TRINITY_DN8707_c0_g1~~TRINITY_DN8707_c0_g1_i1.p2  ORF type:complete len:232 (-),score=62.69 TRINITY_DN8707_c0_g1_i1:1111-1806(-)
MKTTGKRFIVHENVGGSIATNPHDIAMNTIRDNKGAKKEPVRVGRGIGSGKGKTAGRGHKGQKARTSGGTRPGFEGGAYPLYRKARKYGFSNKVFKKEYQEINLDTLQLWIDTGRIDPSKTITMKVLRDSGAIGKYIPNSGVKLLSRGKEFFSAKVNIEVSRASQEAIAAVKNAGGTIETIFYNKLSIRKLMKFEPEEVLIKFTKCPPHMQHRYSIPEPLNPYAGQKAVSA